MAGGVSRLLAAAVICTLKCYGDQTLDSLHTEGDVLNTTNTTLSGEPTYSRNLAVRKNYVVESSTQPKITNRYLSKRDSYGGRKKLTKSMPHNSRNHSADFLADMDVNITEGVVTDDITATTQERAARQKFLFKHMNNLTKDQRKTAIVSITFDSKMDSLEWFRSFDQIFRNSIASLLTNKNSTRKTINPEDIIYIAPTPIRNDSSISLCFVVNASRNQHKSYMSAKELVSTIYDKRPKLKEMLSLRILSVRTGYTGQTPCSKCNEPNENNFIYYLVIAILTAVISTFTIMSFHRLKYWKKYKLQKSTRKSRHARPYGHGDLSDEEISQAEYADDELQDGRSENHYSECSHPNNTGLSHCQITEHAIIHKEDSQELDESDTNSVTHDTRV